MKHARASALATILSATCLTPPAFAQGAEMLPAAPVAQTSEAQQPVAPAETAEAAPAATGGQLDEIVVTARKSSESLQKVPIAITALTASTLENSNARQIRDIATLTPGLNIAGDGLERNQQPSIRGLSFTGGDTSEGNVAVMLDGIYISNPGALSMGILDFERIEVVKGPQSALYGHNAFGGAINYVPKAPPKELEGRVQARVGNYDSHSFMGSVGGPLVDGIVTARLSAIYDRAGGTYEDAVNGKKLGGYKKKDVALQVRITPDDRLTFDIGAYYGDDVFGRPMQASFPNNCAVNAAGIATQYCGRLPSTRSLLPLVAPTYEPEDAVGNKRLVKNLRMKTTLDLDDMTIVLNLGHFNVKQRSYAELFGVRDGLPFQLVGQPAGTVNLPGFFGGSNNNKDYEAELRFASNQNQPLRWAFGAYFYKTKQRITTDVGFDSDPIPAGRSIVCPSTLACLWLTPGAERLGNPGLAYSNNRQASVFGSLAYDITSRLTVSAEARYTDEKRRSNVVAVVTAAPGTAAQNPDGPGQSAKFTFTNPRFTANWKVTDDNLLYASAAKGTKSGGFNQRASLASEQSFGPESNWSYEIGLKNTLFDRRVRLNIAAFYVDWTNLQIQVPSALITNIGPVTQNFGSVKAYGGEIELAARVARGISLSSGLAYTNPKFGSDAYDYSSVGFCRLIPSCAPRIVTNAPSAQGPVSAVSLDGLVRVQVSRWQITGGLDIDRPLTDDWSWFASTNYKYESKQYTQIDTIRYTPSRNTLGLQAGVKNDAVKLTFWVQNALNDLTPYAAGGGIGTTRYNNLQQVPKVNVPERRRLGLTLDYNF